MFGDPMWYPLKGSQVASICVVRAGSGRGLEKYPAGPRRGLAAAHTLSGHGPDEGSGAVVKSVGAE